MTHEDLGKRLADLVQAARDGGLSDEEIINIIQEHVDALRDGLT